MLKNLFRISIITIFSGGLLLLTQMTRAQSEVPKPIQIRPNYNYSEPYGCTRCHFVYGARGDHNLEAVGAMYDDEKQAFYFTGGGWLASKHSQSNYGSTQNTYCAKCHSPLQATPQASFKKGVFKNTEQVPDGVVEGVVCATCHPSGSAARVLGRRLGIYQIGMDRTTPEAYKVLQEGQEDELCLNCHVTRHNERNPAFELMYVAGVRCIDCHMAVYGKTVDGNVDKRFHDWKVANNLPYSCGLEGSVTGCHSEFGVEATRAFIPILKEQHNPWWTKTKRLKSAADYLRVWKELQAQYSK